MSIRAGFAEIDITPPVGVSIIGHIKDVIAKEIMDPLFARAAIIESAGQSIAFIQLDTLSVRWTQTQDIRRRIAEQHGFAPERIMVSATHNHAGPAIANCGEVVRDEAYIEEMTAKTVTAFGNALAEMQEAEVGVGSCFEFGVGHNRRVIMRDGTTRTHANFDDPDALCMEGPIDPEVAVIAARNLDGAPLGALVSFACHPTHQGPGPALTGGFPGVLARTMKDKGFPVTLFLNGAGGNIHTARPILGGANVGMEEAGLVLAEDADGVIAQMEFRRELRLGGRTETIELPYREATEAEIAGTVRGAQRFVDSAIYDRTMPNLLERIKTRGSQPAEVQVLFLDECAFIGIPAEYFVQHGLRIKEEARPRRALIVGWANGMVGYVPHKEAFIRGGYETTFGHWSRLAPEAGDMLADCALGLLAEGPDPA